MSKQIKNSKAKTSNKMSNRYEKQGQSKMINAYGAVGTLVQTFNNGSLMIEPFDRWPYYGALYQKYLNHNNFDYLINNPEFIKDDRLLLRLKTTFDNQLNNLVGLFKLPENESNWNGVETPNKVISARFFSEWFYCPQCNQDNLKHFSQLRNSANPQFPFCAIHGLKKEQFSFMIASKNGEIADIPWQEFLTSNNQIIRFGPNNANNQALPLTFTTGGSAEHLETKKIRANIDGQVITKSLASLTSKTFIDPAGNEYKWVIRQSNNVCFVQTISSVFIPKYTIPALEINNINLLINMGIVDAEAILRGIRYQYPATTTNLDHLNDYLNQLNNPPVNEDANYKKEEYDFIVTTPSPYNFEHLSFERIIMDECGIQNIYKIKRMKVTHVQTGYTRLTPDAINSKKIYAAGTDIKYYPAVEMFGEGIFLELDKVQLNVFLNESNENREAAQIADLVHSLSHCILKELEFECGYPVNSLKERLYFDVEKINNTMQVKYAGILIYTASGSDASFGGLSSLFDMLNATNTMKIEKLIEHAYIRAQDCPNDPICIDEESNGNIGTCHSCNLISEPSCEQFNRGLNRKILNEYYLTFNMQNQY